MKSEKDAVDEESVTDEEGSEFARVFAQLSSVCFKLSLQRVHRVRPKHFLDIAS